MQRNFRILNGLPLNVLECVRLLGEDVVDAVHRLEITAGRQQEHRQRHQVPVPFPDPVLRLVMAVSDSRFAGQKSHIYPTPPAFGPCLLWPSGWMNQDATWYGGIGLSPGHIVLDGDPAPRKKHTQKQINYLEFSIVLLNVKILQI